MLRLLETGAVRGIGDVVDVEAVRRATDRSQFHAFFRQHEAGRARLDANRRNLADSEFHWKLDAANNCLTLAAAKTHGPATYFVTPTPLNVQQCTVGDTTYARLDRTPLFMLNVEEMVSRGAIDDRRHFLELAAREGLELVEDLRRYPTLDDCPGHLQLRIVRFYRDYVAPLMTTTRVQEDTLALEINELEEAVRDPKRVRELVEEASEEARIGAQRLEDHATALDLDYIGEFDFDDDPVLARMRKSLGVLRR